MKDKTTRKEEAAKRLAAYQELSNTQKIVMLDLRLGGGKGAVKQRAKLHKASLKKETILDIMKAITASEKKGKPYQKPKKS